MLWNHCFPVDTNHLFMGLYYLTPIAELHCVIWRMASISSIWSSTFFCQRNQELQKSSKIIKRNMRHEFLSDIKIKAPISGFVIAPETIPWLRTFISICNWSTFSVSNFSCCIFSEYKNFSAPVLQERKFPLCSVGVCASIGLATGIHFPALRNYNFIISSTLIPQIWVLGPRQMSWAPLGCTI